MSIPTPQVLVYQDFNLLPTEITDPLRPLIMGPEAKLHRYAVSTERSSATVYDGTLDSDILWTDLGKAASSTLDLAYTKVYADNAWLKYYESAGAGAAVAGYKNRVRLGSAVLATNSTGSTTVGKDVAVGDGIIVSAIVSSLPYSVAAKVTGLVADASSSSLSGAAGTTNGTTQSASVGSAVSTGATTAITVTSSGTYSGISSGIITETYTISVVRSSTGGLLQNAVVNITSASGTDNMLGVTLPAWGELFDVGTRGVTALMTKNAASDLLVGNSWTITAATAYSTVTGTVSGTYTGTQDTTYIVTCVQGGVIGASGPVMTVTTLNGVDAGPSFVVAVAATAYSVGTKGALIAFNATAISSNKYIKKGDFWVVTATAAGTSYIRTVILDRKLPQALLTGTPALDVSLCIVRNGVKIPPTTTGTNFSTNWTQDETGVAVQSGIYLYDVAWQAGATALPLQSADVYIEWREFITDHADKIYSIDSLADLDSVFTTPVDPDNPLVYGINKALLNSNGTSVRAMAVLSDDVDGYQTVLDKAEIRDDIYSLVPLTYNTAVQQQVAGHTTSLSTPTQGLWRIAWVCPKADNPAAVLRKLDDGVTAVTATIAASGQEYAIELTDAALAGGASFESVNVGDTIRVNFATDAAGVQSYQSLTVTHVDSLEIIRVDTAPDPLIANPVPIEIWRTLDAEGLADEISSNAGVFSSRRVYAVYPDVIESGGTTVPGYFLAAALAGLRGGVAPHQGLTNVTIAGFDNANVVVRTFNRSQLERMAGAGVWLVTHDLKDGSVYSWMEVSTDNTDLNTREQMVTTNVDSISYYLRRSLTKYIGRANVTTALLETLSVDLKAGINYLQTQANTPLLGGQLGPDTKISRIEKHPTLKDHILVYLQLDIPYALNYLSVHLVI